MTLDYDAIMNYSFPEFDRTYTSRDTMLYALGLGLGADCMDENQLRFVYEKDLQAFPTMPAVLGFDPVPLANIPELSSIDFNKLVHGEHKLVLYNPLPAEGRIRCQPRILDIIDKGEGKGAIVYRIKEITNAETGEQLASIEDSIFLRGDGGFGGQPGPTPPVHRLPKSDPETACEIATLPQTALIYRLSGDYNPLHAEPAFARRAGFEKPILHGLCSFGVVGHAILKTCCNYQTEGFKSMQARFSAPVFPGETIRTEMWRDGGVVSFRVRAVERDVVVLNNGKAEIAV